MSYSYWLEGVAMPVVSLMGLIGNIISIVILSNNKSRLDLHPMFVSLCVCLVGRILKWPESRTWFQAVFDCIFLTSSCSIFTVTAVLYPSQVPGISLFLMIVLIVQSYLHMMCLPYLVPVANMAMTGKDNKK